MPWLECLPGEPEPYEVPTWADGTDEEIAEALEKHYAGEIDLTEYWNVGDERTVSLSAMEAMSPLEDTHVAQNVVFVITEIGGKYLSDGVTECAFQVDQKNSLIEQGALRAYSGNTGGWRDCERRTWCNSTYKNAIPSSLRSIFKEFINQSGRGNGSYSGTYESIDTFALRAEKEIFGTITYSVNGEGEQIKWYETLSNRIKQCPIGNDNYWWLRSAVSGGYTFCNASYTGKGTSSESSNYSYPLAPFGVL